MKKVLKFIAIAASIFVFAGCTSGLITKDKINADTVTVYYDKLSNAKPLVFSSSNPDDATVIKELTTIVSKVGEYKIVPQDKLCSGNCEMWLKFGEDTVIGIYGDMDYGYVGTSIDPVGTEAMYLPEGLSKCLRDIVDVYGYTYQSFRGKVTAVHEDSITITPNDDTSEIKTSDSIVVSITEYTKLINGETLDALTTRDIPVDSTVEITYDGNIEESYPAGIPGATIISVCK
jgi:hypothetical protein